MISLAPLPSKSQQAPVRTPGLLLALALLVILLPQEARSWPAGHYFVTGPYKGMSGITVFDEQGVRVYSFGIYIVRDPMRMTLDMDGNLLVSDSFDGNVKIFAPPDQLIRTVGDGYLLSAAAVAVGPENEIYVGDRIRGEIRVFGPSGEFRGAFGGEALLDTGDIAVSSDGRVIVADGAAGKIRVFSRAGELVGSIESDTGSFALDEMDFLYLPGLESVGKYDLGGNRVKTIPLDGLRIPSSIHVDSRGHLVLLDFLHGWIQVHDQEGALLQEFGGDLYKYSKEVWVAPREASMSGE